VTQFRIGAHQLTAVAEALPAQFLQAAARGSADPGSQHHRRQSVQRLAGSGRGCRRCWPSVPRSSWPNRGGKRTLALSDFILGPRKIDLRPDEIASAILIPKPKGAAHSSFVKLGARKYLVISIVMAAGYLDVVGSRIVEARIAIGSCSPVALRLPALEAALKGEVAISNLARLVKPEHLAPLAPIDDVRASADYREEAALVVVRRLLSELAV
jgi:CO/xanthine dehydrogenase FAD-binding subunit